MRYFLILLTGFLPLQNSGWLHCSDIWIYSGNNAQIHEKVLKEFPESGIISFSLTDFPERLISSSLVFRSECAEISTFEYTFKIPNRQNFLQNYIGKNIQLVRYGESGEITYSTEGKLLFFQPQPVFEIQGKIVIDPPYDYIFPEFPESLRSLPVVRVSGITRTTECAIDYSYLAKDFEWSASYSMFIENDSEAQLESWFKIMNLSGKSMKNTNVTLVSGSIKFADDIVSPLPVRRNIAKAFSSGDMNYESAHLPEADNSGDYVLFSLPEQMDLPAHSEKNVESISPKKVRYEKSYHFRHIISYRNQPDANPVNFPVITRYTVPSGQLENFNHPSGVFRIYENLHGENIPVLVGSDVTPVISSGDPFIINTGRTHDITAQYQTKNIESYRQSTIYHISVVFSNRKDRDISVEFTEVMNRPDWKIMDSNFDFVKKDATTAMFNIPVARGEEIELTLSVEILK